MAKEMIDFSSIEVPKQSGYLAPGHYNVSAQGAKFVKPEGKKQNGDPKTSYVEITFGNDKGNVTEKFYLSQGALGRLQYLFESWFGKKLEKAFEDYDQIGLYFEKLFNDDKAKSIKKKIIVGGTKEGIEGRVYAGLPYSGYVLPDDMDIEEGAFDPGSANYITYVTVKYSTNNPSTTSNSTILEDASMSGSSSNAGLADDLPF